MAQETNAPATSNPPTARMTLQDAIDVQQLGRLQLFVIAVCFAVSVLDGYEMQCIGYAATGMKAHLGLSSAQLGAIFSCGPLGYLLGALICGPIADRIGRRPVVTSATFLLALFALMTATAHTTTEFIVWRMLTGIGVGLAAPSTMTLTAEYTPMRVRRFSVALVNSGFPVGPILAGFLAAVFITRYGWQGIFTTVAVGGFVIFVFSLFLAPESLLFMTRKENRWGKAERIIARIAPQFAGESKELLAQNQRMQREKTAVSIRQLFAGPAKLVTIGFWIISIMCMLVGFFIMSWMPLLAMRAGIPLTKAIVITTCWAVGAMLGGPIGGACMDRFDPRRILILLAAVGALCWILLAAAGVHATLLMIITTVLGFANAGVQVGLYALIATVYPAFVRATAVGWQACAGRVGAFVGPAVGAALIGLGWKMSNMLYAASIPMFIATAAAIGLLFCAPQLAHAPMRKPQADEAKAAG